MGHDVYAEGREILTAASSGKVVAAFPDVCKTPSGPAVVPVPYAVIGQPADLTKGSTTVLSHGAPIMLRGKSLLSRCSGDEAGTAGGVISNIHLGACKPQSASPTVRVQGKAVVRHGDLITLNHNSSGPGNTPTWPYLAKTHAAGAGGGPCEAHARAEVEACKEFAPYGPRDACTEAGITTKPKTGDDATALDMGEAIANPDSEACACLAKRRCQLAPYQPRKGQTGCCPGQTPHHLVAAASFHNRGRGGRKRKDASEPFNTSIPVTGCEGYDQRRAPCICAEGTSQNDGTHGLLHTATSVESEKITTTSVLSFNTGAVDLSHPDELPLSHPDRRLTFAASAPKPGDLGTMHTRSMTYAEARTCALAAVTAVFPESGCDPDCTRHQLDAYHHSVGIQDDTPIRNIRTGRMDSAAQAKVKENAERRQAMNKGSTKHKDNNWEMGSASSTENI